jgi:hypothetical protein
MSLSNPTQNARNPSTRWFEWHGSKGQINYWDKEAKKKVFLDLPFTFLLLDELATVRGFHEPSNSGVFANEVRDTRQETMLVRAFEGGEIASGLYASIRDRVKAHGGYFQASCYIAYKDGDALKIGNLGLNGASLQAWSEFKKGKSPYGSAVVITGFEDRTKGATKYRIPTFTLKATSPETVAKATALDAELQTFLTGYLKQPRTEQAAKPAAAHVDDEQPPLPDAVPAGGGGGGDGFEDDDIPFITRHSVW